MPTIAAIPVLGSCYSQLAIVLSTWRQNGILKRVRVTPLPAWTYFLGLLAHRFMVSAVDVAMQEPSSPSVASAGTPDPNDQCSIRRKAMCPHLPVCPPADRPDRDAARSVASHPEQGWSLLCNGVIVFDDLGEILPGGGMVPPHRLVRSRLPVAA